MIDWFIFLLILYLVVDFFCISTSDEDDDRIYSHNLTTVVVMPNEATVENKPEDDLPPYTPPTPKTQAALADLPPSYNETWDITEVNISNNINSNSNDINSNDTNTNNPTIISNVNTVNNNMRNLPTNHSMNTNQVPDIVINPVNYASAQAQPV
ncbi:hypothetical protein LY90DRAFT_704799, partial [Neocallimastix californiae]